MEETFQYPAVKTTVIIHYSKRNSEYISIQLFCMDIYSELVIILLIIAKMCEK